MKIIGFVQYNGRMVEGTNGESHSGRMGEQTNGESHEWEMVLKGDSCLLNGRKPLFVPDWTNEPVMTPCAVLRVSRLGKEIAPRFACRYYDAVAPGIDFAAADLLRKAHEEGGSWTEAIAFDYSLAIGEWMMVNELTSERVNELMNEWVKEWLISPEEAIAHASKVMTIRQGDMIYIQAKQAPQPIVRDQVISMKQNGEEKLYCKIK
ncbi:MAG: fumarylacetoacetate hydrolase family protein [Paludibacteraceae bacterium]|nr:fumarylacetoacetate hydrolase family protein [Paludibacteraceae bacterium]